MPNPLSLQPVNEIPLKEKTVLAAGRIGGWYAKGFDVLIKSWKKLQDLNDNVNDDDNLRDWWLKIAGAGKQESFEYLINILPDGEWVFNDNFNDDDNHLNTKNTEEKGIYTDKLNSQKSGVWRSEKYHIEFLGFRKDIEELYKQSAIFALSSRYEGFGLVLIEAMSQGCACVACDYKGRQREIIQDDNQGLCCEPDNVNTLATALEKMIMDEAYRKKVQKNALERSNFYDMEHTMNRWEAYLKTVVNAD
jgi:glycosyltransferase involved in cell wall biosynthesis